MWYAFFVDAFDDITNCCRRYSTQFFVSIGLIVVGCIIGIVIGANGYVDLSANEVQSLYIVVVFVNGGFFTVFFRLLLESLLLLTILVLLSFASWLNTLKLVVIFLLSIMFGRFVSCAFVLVNIVGGVFVAVFLVLDMLALCLVVFCSYGAYCHCNLQGGVSFREAISYNKHCCTVLALWHFAKIIIVFVILRAITGVI